MSWKRSTLVMILIDKTSGQEFLIELYDEEYHGDLQTQINEKEIAIKRTVDLTEFVENDKLQKADLYFNNTKVGLIWGTGFDYAIICFCN